LPVENDDWRAVLARLEVKARKAARAKPLPAARPRLRARPARRFSKEAATIQDAAGQVLQATWGGTACWFPNRPARFSSIGRDGSESTLRCKHCPGCRRLDQLQLCRRLAGLTQNFEEDLCYVEVHASSEAATNRLKRRCSYLLSELTARLGTRSPYYAGSDRASFRLLLAAAKLPYALRRRLMSLGAERVVCRPIRRGRKRRFTSYSFKGLTAGCLRPRGDGATEIAPDAKRFYHRTLAPLETEPRQVLTRQSIKDRHPEASELTRGWRAGKHIVLPEALYPIVKRRGRHRPKRRSVRHSMPARLRDLLAGALRGG
jgi:hypothetical protein